MKIISETKKIFKYLDKELDEKQKEAFKKSFYFELDKYQDSLGKFITSNFLQINSPLFKEFLKCGILLAEDMAMFIIVLYYMKLRSESPDKTPEYIIL